MSSIVPTLVTLLNNILATYNLAATARTLNLAAEHGVPAKDLFEANLAHRPPQS